MIRPHDPLISIRIAKYNHDLRQLESITADILAWLKSRWREENFLKYAGGLQMVLRLLAHNAENWLASHLNAYLRDDDEYRAITRQTIIGGLVGTITSTPGAITVTLQQPGAPRITRALALLIDEINNDPPAMPGNPRPITYQLAPAHTI